MTTIRTAYTILLAAFGCLACDEAEFVAADVEECPVLEPEFACEVVACEVDEDAPGQPMLCTVARYIEPGHEADFAIGIATGEVGWNAWPHDADAGEWERMNYAGHGSECEQIEILTANLPVNADGERGIYVVCEDSTLGVWDWVPIALTDRGPVIN